MLSHFLNNIKKNTDFRIKLFLFLSLVFNFIYAIFLFVTSLVYSSNWFLIMSVYYGLLTTTRVFIFLQAKNRKEFVKQILLMRNCECFLFLLNFIVSIMMFFLINSTQTIKYHEITVIANAAYTFSTLSIAIISSAKHFKKDYVYSCAKMISLISASVSMVTLTNNMLATFGDKNLILRAIILPIFSAVVSIFIIVCAIIMVLKANLELGCEKNEKERK